MIKINNKILIMFGLLSFFGYANNKLEKIITELHSPDKEVRSKAIDNLEKCKINKRQQIYLLNEATKDFPPVIYERETIPELLVAAGTKTQNDIIPSVIKKNLVNLGVIRRTGVVETRKMKIAMVKQRFN